MPAALRQLLWIDYFKPDGYERLKQALDSRAQALGKMQANRSRSSGFLPGSFGSGEKTLGSRSSFSVRILSAVHTCACVRASHASLI